jgi:hypothetical protein
VPFDLLEALGMVGEAATDIPSPRNRRERIGCWLGFAVIVAVVVILLLASLI